MKFLLKINQTNNGLISFIYSKTSGIDILDFTIKYSASDATSFSKDFCQTVVQFFETGVKKIM